METSNNVQSIVVSRSKQMHYTKSPIKLNIFDAAKAGNIQQLKKFLNDGFNINEKEKSRQQFTPLHWACHQGHLEAVHWILWNGANISKCANHNWTSVHVAAIRGNDACLKALINTHCNLTLVDDMGCQATHLAAIHGHSFTLNTILRTGVDANAVDNNNWTPIHHAAFYGRLGCLQVIRKWGGAFDVTDCQGNTPLHHAAAEGNLECLKYMVIEICSNLQTNEEDKESYQKPDANISIIDSMHLSKIKKPKKQCCIFLKDRNNNGDTARMIAEQFNKTNICEFIDIFEWNSENYQEKSDLRFPGHVAAYTNDLSHIQFLIDHGLINLNERDHCNSTMAHKAAGQGHMKILKWLIEIGASMDLVNNSNETPYDTATTYGQIDAIRLLSKYNINEEFKDVPIKNELNLNNKSEKNKIEHDNLDKPSDIEEWDFKPININNTDVINNVISKEEYKLIATRAYRRVEKIQNTLDLAKKNYIQLGGIIPKEAQQNTKLREMEEKCYELREQLDYERLKRENLEAKLDEYKYLASKKTLTKPKESENLKTNKNYESKNYHAKVAFCTVLSIDAGVKYIKVAYIKRGKIDILLNKNTDRKTEAIIAFIDNTRYYSDNAAAVITQYPKNTFQNIGMLLGESLDSDAAKFYKKMFPYHVLGWDEEAKSITMWVDELQTNYTVEEIYSMILKDVYLFSLDYTKDSIYDIVLTVPSQSKQSTRIAYFRSAKMAGIKLTQLLNTNTAVAINFALKRPASEIKEVEHYIFIDVGAGHAQTTLASISSVKEAGKQVHKIDILNYQSLDHVGGSMFKNILTNYILNIFINENKKFENEIRNDYRIFTRIETQVQKAIVTLSVNDKYLIFIESLYLDIDLKTMITIDEFNDMCKVEFNRIASLLEHILDQCELMDIVPKLAILMGGSSRIPKIQNLLTQKFGKPLAQIINTDEAAALGGVYQAAKLSKTVRINSINVVDAYSREIVISYNKSNSNQIVTRRLFSKFNKYPSRKSIILTNRNEEFYVKLGYSKNKESSGKSALQTLSETDIITTKISGMQAAIDKMANTTSSYEEKGVKSYFVIDDSGIISVEKSEIVFNVTKDDVDVEESWLGSLFGSSNDSQVIDLQNSTDSKEINIDPNLNLKETASGESVPSRNVSDSVKISNTTNTTISVPVEKKPAFSIKRIKLKVELDSLYYTSKEKLESSLKKIKALDTHDENLERIQKIINDIQSTYFDAKYKFEDEDIMNMVTSESEREEVMGKLNNINDWLDESMYDKKVLYEDYLVKLEEMHDLLSNIYSREFEYLHRQEGIDALRQYINTSFEFKKMYKEYIGKNLPMDETDDEKFTYLIISTEEWLNKTLSEQNKIKATETPVLKIKDIRSKLTKLGKEAKILSEKIKNFVPEKNSKDLLKTLKEMVKSGKETISSFVDNILPSVEDGKEKDEENTINNLLYQNMTQTLNLTIIDTEKWIDEKANNETSLPTVEEFEEKIQKMYQDATLLNKLVNSSKNDTFDGTVTDNIDIPPADEKIKKEDVKTEL
ncbi:Hypoxia up-regulated protein 1 [Intoshia linei]|uniref:Hypoxia up-regulated protein 1 n=1 Tax=Intoshia linei TaxID=1819745 RepID=A0A177AX65_9BILA|nr:Hypoxia up-regulated protein 1 [Intoshia linei]